MIDLRRPTALLALWAAIQGGPALAQGPAAPASSDAPATDEASPAEAGAGEGTEPGGEAGEGAEEATPAESGAPGSDPGAAAPTVDEAAQAAAEGLPPEIVELVREVQALTAEAEEYRRDVATFAEDQYERRRAAVNAQYGRLVDQLTVEERKRRDDAIGRFEEFLVKYSDNPRYTPDALFRLAELYFERSNDQYVAALEDYEKRYKEYEQGKVEEEPPQPRQDYRQTIQTFDSLIQRWPQYSRIDGAYYLKGYCLLEMGEEKDALDQFLYLVENHPKSRFAPETWTRIGEYYFDDNQLAKAIDAYMRVLQYKDSPYYDKALYKLAWTYYRDDQYDNAIQRFRELIEYSDAQAEKTGTAGSELRSEAVQYLAISLQEEDWNADGAPDADAGFARVIRHVKGDKAYEVDVLKAVAVIFFDNTKYDESIETLRYLLKKFPENAENPELHQQMILSYERMRKFDEAFAERDLLARTYGAGSDWHRANEQRPKVVAAAEKMVEQALIQAATWHHHRAQTLKQEAIAGNAASEEAAIREYRLAAVGYEDYLKKYPRSENTYELSFFYAECLYYSFRFAEAAEAYALVRDSKLGTKHRETAAFSAVLAHENHLVKLIEEGRLEARPSLTNKAEDEAPPPRTAQKAPAEGEAQAAPAVQPDAIPDPVLALLAARETYVKGAYTNSQDASRLPRIAYKIGEVYFDYRHYDKAREWFAWLVEKHPREKVTVYAARNIIDSYRQAGDWQKMAEWSEIVAKANLGSEEERKALASEVGVLKVGAEFKQAEELFSAGKYEQAAEQYVRLVDENPENKFADRALNNAAVSFEKTRRFESATNTYERLYRTYPKSEHAEGALFRVGVNSERFYDYDRAVASHLKLVESYPQSEHRADSLFQAALLQEQTQRYRESAANFERYAELFPGREDTAETFYRSARNYEKLKDTRNAMRVYQTFVTRYGSDPKNNKLTMEALGTIADLHEKEGREKEARKAYDRVINEFNTRGLAAGTYEARFPAKARFKLVEYDFQRYSNLKLVGSLPNQGRIIKDIQGQLKTLQRQYAEVIEYKDFEWTLAAFYRLGHIYQLFAERLYEAPIPDSFDPEMEDQYRTQLEDIAVPIEDEAVKRYEEAFAKAREFRVTNEWTKRILQALNKYKPSDYPLFKEERRLMAEQNLTPARLLPPPPPPGAEAGADAPPPAEPGAEGEK